MVDGPRSTVHRIQNTVFSSSLLPKMVDGSDNGPQTTGQSLYSLWTEVRRLWTFLFSGLSSHLLNLFTIHFSAAIIGNIRNPAASEINRPFESSDVVPKTDCIKGV